MSSLDGKIICAVGLASDLHVVIKDWPTHSTKLKCVAVWFERVHFHKSLDRVNMGMT